MKIFKMAKMGVAEATMCCLLLFYGAAVGEAAESTISIVAPPDKVWVDKAEINITGSTSGPAESVKISGAGKVEVMEGGGFAAAVELDKGLNKLKIQSGESVMELQLFYTPDSRKQAPPKDFKKFYSHVDTGEVLECKVCHRFSNGSYQFKKMIPARANCANCHDDVGQSEHVHGPVGAGVCISCHNPHGTLNRAFLPKSGSDLCLVCHQARQQEFSREVIHPPLEDGCTDCHSPHESAHRYQLKYDGDSLSNLCFGCHDQDMFMQNVTHSPVQEGDCIACHQPHSSDNASLLVAPLDGGQLCFECHDYMKEDFEMEVVHPPVEESCTECHDPHSTKAKKLLKGELSDLCASCHRDYTPEVYEAIDNAKVQHPPVAEGECVTCHRPHSSNNASLLADNMESLCTSCHDSLIDVISESEGRHGPVKTGDCTACHNVHGSSFAKLLVRYYPVEFYSEYGPNKYDLCFGCHNPDIAKTRRTETLTSFRDGSYNLHYFHVNNEKGRTCTACHDPHASDQAKHIRYEVPFGAWSYPINFTITPTGGRCVVGCHAPKKFDRQNPQLNK